MAKLVLGPCCSVVGCSLRPGTNLMSQIKVFRFPKDTQQREAWTAAVRRENWTPSVNSRVCSTHFITGRPSDDPLHPDYAPSKLLHKPQRVKATERYCKSVKRAASAPTHPEAGPVTEMQIEPEGLRYKSTSVGTDLSMKDIEGLLSEHAALKNYIKKLETKLKACE
ncbi:peroxynitrite isomerase THAP4-like [Epinephelus fuscoguttatus]|uniref:peroxynitrite isomerase THAP4-like n=1 Tax=Epinephelus fuscoguttatus TaxID=293821 RepID=UPI0020D19F82|nr:peroxynitrite isomerase THAP4-like [Epinephelus fuscoguttatus]